MHESRKFGCQIEGLLSDLSWRNKALYSVSAKTTYVQQARIGLTHPRNGVHSPNDDDAVSDGAPAFVLDLRRGNICEGT
jgi:hypothetical protein